MKNVVSTSDVRSARIWPLASAATFGGKNLAVGKKRARAGWEHQREAKPNRSKNTRVGPPSRRRLVAIALDRAAAAAIARGINPVQHPARRRRALVLQGALAGKC